MEDTSRSDSTSDKKATRAKDTSRFAKVLGCISKYYGNMGNEQWAVGLLADEDGSVFYWTDVFRARDKGLISRYIYKPQVHMTGISKEKIAKIIDDKHRGDTELKVLYQIEQYLDGVFKNESFKTIYVYIATYMGPCKTCKLAIRGLSADHFYDTRGVKGVTVIYAVNNSDMDGKRKYGYENAVQSNGWFVYAAKSS